MNPKSNQRGFQSADFRYDESFSYEESEFKSRFLENEKQLKGTKKCKKGRRCEEMGTKPADAREVENMDHLGCIMNMENWTTIRQNVLLRKLSRVLSREANKF